MESISTDGNRSEYIPVYRAKSSKLSIVKAMAE